jgi:predicted dehydrogenase
MFPGAKLTRNAADIFKTAEIDAVAIALPAKLHYRFAKEALLKGKHCLVEKPLAMSSKEAGELTRLAYGKKIILMVSHTFLYNAAVRKLKEYITNGELGEVFYLYSKRLNLGIIRRDINALWNFGPHDVSIACYLLDDVPVSVSAKGLRCVSRNLEDVVFLNLDFKNGICAHMHLSWLDPKRVRETVVVGSRKMAIYDDTNPDARLRILTKDFSGIKKRLRASGYMDYSEFQLSLRQGDCFIPRINFKEPLKEECDHFIDCIINSRTPLTEGKSATMVVRILELAQASIENGGRPVRYS